MVNITTNTITVQQNVKFEKQASAATVQAIGNTAAALPQKEASQLMSFAKFLMGENIIQYRKWSAEKKASVEDKSE